VTQRLATAPGIGPIRAALLVAIVAKRGAFPPSNEAAQPLSKHEKADPAKLSFPSCRLPVQFSNVPEIEDTAIEPADQGDVRTR
jgi:hypothetical protein